MLRPSAVVVLALAVLLSIASTGCSAPAAASRENSSLRDVARGASFLVDPGSLDVQNVHLPAVLIFAHIFDPFGKISRSACTGVLIRPRVVITAGHCLCLFNSPTTPQERRPSEKSRRGAVLTRARELRDVAITEILDNRSSCAQTASVSTLVYGLGTDGGRPTVKPVDYYGSVLIHPEIELIAGTTNGRTGVVWNNADLAAVILDRPVPPEVKPVALSDSEVEVGDALVMMGYGTANPGIEYALRQSGNNEVTQIFRLDTGSVFFSAVVPPRLDHDLPAQAHLGDSGGGCVRRENPNVLLGVITMGAQAPDGTPMTLFTSIFPHRRWLSEIMRRVDLGADAGMSVPGSDAGWTPSPR